MFWGRVFEASAGDEVGHSMGRQTVHPALPPQLRHDGVGKGEAPPCRQQVFVLAQGDLLAPAIALHAVEAQHAMAHRVKASIKKSYQNQFTISLIWITCSNSPVPSFTIFPPPCCNMLASWIVIGVLE